MRCTDSSGWANVSAFDFIVRTADGAYQHWEIAEILFVVGRPNALESLAWSKPERPSRQKGQSDATSQIPLSRRTAALEVLHAFGATSIEQHVALLKGIFCVGRPTDGPPHASMAPLVFGSVKEMSRL